MTLHAIEREIVRIEEKIESYKQKAKDLRKRKVDEENAQFIRAVRAADLSVPELQRLLTFQKSDAKKEDLNV